MGAFAMRFEDAARVRPAGQVEVGVVALLEWAFAVEFAQLEFDEMAATSGAGRVGVGNEYLLMQCAMVGCTIDGGGRSLPHDDADIVASIVAGLPVIHGGRGMAVTIAELARARAVPDWMRDARPRVVPREWRQHKHGVFAATRVCGTVQEHSRKRGLVTRDVMCCDVLITPTAHQIEAARARYSAWWRALRAVRDQLARASLDRWLVTDAMPPRAPWQKRC
ncbi:hypothetical protein [Roseicitreum antarcticum]|uniref:Uncharacterized protein n=1 Tax=Roseicitreum antarcticum TaxID=564137 RepID=A0A1H3FMB6_9RHOB|nr:hypothetical protein [Roseicitreum antarcticum]SDX92080.1 hypothetical protein SAMN04488238_14315 [Roseicitreum antarcticum]